MKRHYTHFAAQNDRPSLDMAENTDDQASGSKSYPFRRRNYAMLWSLLSDPGPGTSQDPVVAGSHGEKQRQQRKVMADIKTAEEALVTSSSTDFLKAPNAPPAGVGLPTGSSVSLLNTIRSTGQNEPLESSLASFAATALAGL